MYKIFLNLSQRPTKTRKNGAQNQDEKSIKIKEEIKNHKNYTKDS